MRQSINKFMEEDLKEDVETFDLEGTVYSFLFYFKKKK